MVLFIKNQMKTIQFFIMVFLAMSMNAVCACDACGGGSSGAWNGWIPQFGKSQFQLRNEWRHNLGIGMGSYKADQYFFQSDLSFRYFSSEKWMFQATVPTRRTKIQYADSSLTWSGIGDVRWGVNRVLLKTKSEGMWNGLLLAGVQWQMPTGKYMRRDEGKMMLPLYLQNGSGAQSVLLQYYALLSNSTMGFWSSGGYQAYGENELRSQWGNRWQSQWGIFSHTKKFNAFRDVGQVWGMLTGQYEQNLALREFNASVKNTAAYAISIQAQCDVYWKTGVLGFFGTKVLSVSDQLAVPISGWRFGTSLTWAF
jgi:hypothetical protein